MAAQPQSVAESRDTLAEVRRKACVAGKLAWEQLFRVLLAFRPELAHRSIFQKSAGLPAQGTHGGAPGPGNWPHATCPSGHACHRQHAFQTLYACGRLQIGWLPHVPRGGGCLCLLTTAATRGPGQKLRALDSRLSALMQRKRRAYAAGCAWRRTRAGTSSGSMQTPCPGSAMAALVTEGDAHCNTVRRRMRPGCVLKVGSASNFAMQKRLHVAGLPQHIAVTTPRARASAELYTHL